MTNQEPKVFQIQRGPFKGRECELEGRFLRGREQMIHVFIPGKGKKFVFPIEDLVPVQRQPVWRK